MKHSCLAPWPSNWHLKSVWWRLALHVVGGIGLWLLSGVGFRATAASQLPELRTAEAARSLTPDQAAQHYPVQLRGVVTYFDDPQHYHFFQDGTAGIYFKLREGIIAPDLYNGYCINIEGETDKGEYAPVIIAERIISFGPSQLPVAKPVSFEQLVSGQEDSQFVEVKGIVRCVRMDQSSNHLVDILSDGRRLTALLRDLPAEECDRLPDSAVRVHGVCAPRFNRQSQLFENWILVPRLEDLIVETPAPPDPFAMQTQSISSLLGFKPNGPYGHRVKVAGTVTYRPNDKRIFLQDEHSGLSVETSQAGFLRPGDRVEALGFLAFGDYTPVMQDAVFRKTASGPEPIPDPITVGTALLGTNDCRIVRIEATVLDRAIHIPEPFLVLQADGFIFHAQMDSEEMGMSFDALQNDTKVAVTGICRIEKGENWNAGNAWRAKSFFILLRSPQDVAVVELPPWWTLQKLLWLTGALALVMFGISAWVIALRRRVELLQQREALQRERIRIAQDIHDEIGSKLAKISYLSDAVTRETRDDNLFAGKIASIADTSRDLLSSLDRTVWAVNPANDSLEHLVNYLGQYAREYFQDTPILCRLHLPRSLPAMVIFAEVRHNVLLAFEEVLSNVVKHSGATEVDVRVSLGLAAFEVVVTDNGCGFDADKSATLPVTAAPPNAPRQGLTGLHRRLKELSGRFELNSQPGSGTLARLIIPLPGVFKHQP